MNELTDFATTPVAQEQPLIPVYNHGFSEEAVRDIKARKKEIDGRNLWEFPVTREEFKNVVVPWIRINRTEAFNLQKPKAIKEPKAPKEPKVPKEKKLTKKQQKEKLSLIIVKRVSGIELTEEEALFYQEYTEQGAAL